MPILFKKIFIFFPILVLLSCSFVFVKTVNAAVFGLIPVDNDDSQFKVCQITINSTSITPGESQLVFPRPGISSNTYSIRVCGNTVFNSRTTDQGGTPIACMADGDRDLVASIGSNLFDWKTFTLTKGADGCFSTDVILPINEKLGDKFDIELDDNGSGDTCDSKMPVCRRVTPRFVDGITEADQKVCDAQIEALRSCSFIEDYQPIINPSDIVTFTGTVPEISNKCYFTREQLPYVNRDMELTLTDPSNNTVSISALEPGEKFTKEYQLSKPGVYEVTMVLSGGGETDLTKVTCQAFRVCLESDTTCTSKPTEGTDLTNESLPFELCKQVSDEPPPTGGDSPQKTCEDCLDATNDGKEPKGIWTAVGCIETKPKAIIESVVQIGVGVGGGIALLMTLIGGFLLTTSQGDPKRTQEGKDMITSSVIGVIFILFSVVALQFIGVTILRLPGFGVS